MDSQLDVQRRVARICLQACEQAGFLLCGGSALREHGITTRPTEDIDLFTNHNDPTTFAESVATTRTALEEAGLSVVVARQLETFATLEVTTTTGQQVGVDMGLDWRAHDEGVRLDIGPVLHKDDAVANKVLAVFGRTEARDFLDLDAIMATGEYSVADVLALAPHYDPGFDLNYFEKALRQVTTMSPERVAAYGVCAQEWKHVQHRITDMANTIHSHRVRELSQKMMPPLRPTHGSKPQHLLPPSSSPQKVRRRDYGPEA